MKIGLWNIRGLYGKEKLLQEEFFIVDTIYNCVICSKFLI